MHPCKYEIKARTRSHSGLRWVEIDQLFDDLDFQALYCRYKRGGDTWERGFPEIYSLELEMMRSAKAHVLGPEHMRYITYMSDIPEHNQTVCPDRISAILYIGDAPAYWLMHKPESGIRVIEDQIPGICPTHASMMLRFAVPLIFGAIDPLLMRIFGCGDPEVQCYHLLDLAAISSGTNWTIPGDQVGWPEEYGVWIATLRAIASKLNREEICCPHPESFPKSGLRSGGIWTAADVEMALSRYASEMLRRSEEFKSR